jgi:hypothetical protein
VLGGDIGNDAVPGQYLALLVLGGKGTAAHPAPAAIRPQMRNSTRNGFLLGRCFSQVSRTRTRSSGSMRASQQA